MKDFLLCRFDFYSQKRYKIENFLFMPGKIFNGTPTNLSNLEMPKYSGDLGESELQAFTKAIASQKKGEVIIKVIVQTSKFSSLSEFIIAHVKSGIYPGHPQFVKKVNDCWCLIRSPQVI
jgi:hypothetical protein